jgi:hypothetical protein
LTPRCPWGGFLEAGPGYLFGDPPWAFPGVVLLGWVGGGFYAEVPLGWVSGGGPGVPFRRPALGLPWGGLVEVGRRWVEFGVPWG